jgi:hypothetical protein
MTHRRQILGVLAGLLIAATWASGTAAHPERQMARHGAVDYLTLGNGASGGNSTATLRVFQNPMSPMV